MYKPCTSMDNDGPVYRIQVYQASVFCCFSSERTDIPTIQGCRPRDLFQEIDVWLWGGLALVTNDEIQTHELFICVLTFTFLLLSQSDFIRMIPTLCVSSCVLLLALLECSRRGLHIGIQTAVTDWFEPKFAKAGLELRYVVEPRSSWWKWNQESYFTISKLQPGSASTETDREELWPKHSVGDTRIPPAQCYFFGCLMLRTPGCVSSSNIDFWTLGGVKEHIQSKIGPDLLSYHIRARFAFICLPALAYCLGFLKLVPFFNPVPSILLFETYSYLIKRLLHYKFGARIQQALQDIAPQVQERTGYTPQYGLYSPGPCYCSSSPAVEFLPVDPE